MSEQEIIGPDRDAAVAMHVAAVVAALDSSEEIVNDDEASHSREELLRYIDTLGEVSRVAGELQAQAVLSAHEAGVSWSKIGGQLGVSRQAVQQRFDPRYRTVAATNPQEYSTGSVEGARPRSESRVLGPVSRSEELHHLNVAGAQGWRLTTSGHGQHELRLTHTAWEVCRASVLLPKRLPSPDDGWIAAATRFPDCFYVRPISEVS